MRHGMRWTWALALGLGLGLVALARADEDEAKPVKTGNWFTRLFVRDPLPKKKDSAAIKDDTTKPVSPTTAQIRKKAEWELLRRQEVCEKLRIIALQTGDKDLARKADDLDQRAWDVYVQRSAGPKGSPAPDELSGSASANLEGRTAARKE